MPITSVKISKEFLSQTGNIWLGAEVTLSDTENTVDEILKANETLNDAYLKINEMPIIQREKIKPKMDMVILKKYNKALTEKDTATINQLESSYHVEPK